MILLLSFVPFWDVFSYALHICQLGNIKRHFSISLSQILFSQHVVPYIQSTVRMPEGKRANNISVLILTWSNTKTSQQILSNMRCNKNGFALKMGSTPQIVFPIVRLKHSDIHEFIRNKRHLKLAKRFQYKKPKSSVPNCSFTALNKGRE